MEEDMYIFSYSSSEHDEDGRESGKSFLNFVEVITQ